MKAAKKLVALTGLLVLSAFSYALTEQEIQQITSAMPGQPVVKPAAQRTLLVFSLCKGHVHSCVPYWSKALEVMSEKTGAFKVVDSTDMSVFNADTLKQYDAICFNNTTQLTPDAAQQKAIMDFVKDGKGIVGIHAATDNFNNWPEGMEMMGGVFSGHPWGGNGTWAVKVDDPRHPLMQSFKGQGFKIKDEIYRTAAPLYSRTRQRVLMSLDMSDPTTKNADGVTPEDMDTGISWVKPVGKGRLFYCSLGHDHAVTWNPAVLTHYLAGIQYAMGDLKADDAPLGQTPDAEKLAVLIESVKQYDWDKSRAPLTQLSAYIREQKSPDRLKVVETKLLEVLGMDISLAAKDAICRELSLIGSQASVPVLAAMVEAKQTSDMARYALERIPLASVDELLLKKLQTVQDQTIQIGIINSLGVRRCDAAVPALSALAAGPDTVIADAAIEALGAIGNSRSAAALKTLTAKEHQGRALDALLACADSMSEEGQKSDAQTIYRKLYEQDYPVLIRVGAMNGLVKTGAAEAVSILSAAIEGDDSTLQATAIGNVAVIDDSDFLKTIAAKLETLPDTARIQVCAALAVNPKKIGCREVESLVGSSQKDVRAAAYQSLAVLGEASSVMPLAKAAAGSADRDEIQQARTALYALSGPDVNKAVVDAMASGTTGADEKVTVELIRAADQRGISEAVPVLFKTARNTNPAIAAESVRALQGLATPKDIDEMVNLLIEKPGAPTETALVVVAERIEDRNQRARAILTRYDAVPKEEVKASLLRVLGKLGDSNAVTLLKKEKDAGSQMLRDTAVRVMTDWPGRDFMDEIRQMVRQEQDEKLRILAFRAYVRLLTDAPDQSSNAGVDALIEAFAMAPRTDEQRLVIGAMGSFATDKALEFVAKAMDNPDLKAEAQASAVAICEKGGVKNLAQAQDVLKRLITAPSSETVKERAQKLLNED